MPGEPQYRWRDLCEAASKEQDSEILMALISELMKVLDEPNAPPDSVQAA